MIEGGDLIAAGTRRASAADPDARWRPAGATAVVDAAQPPNRTDRAPVDDLALTRARHPRSDGPPASPWSRAAVEAPLPSIDQIRTRWRDELGLDRLPSARPPSPPKRTDDTAREGSSSTGDVVLAGLVVAAVVAAALAFAWVLVPPAAVEAVATPALPHGTDRAWTIAVGESALVALGDEIVVVADTDDVAAYSSADGGLVWTRPFERGGNPAGVGVYDDVVVTPEQTTGTVLTISGLDAATGETRWSRPGPFSEVDLLAGAPVEYSSPDWTTRLRVLDPATGELIGSEAHSVELAAPEHFVIGRQSGELVLFDLAGGALVSPSVDEFGLRSIASVGGHVTALTDTSDIILFDASGRALDQLAFVSDAFGDFTGRAELVGGVPGTSIGIVASGTSIGFDVADDTIDVVWEIQGRVGTPVETRFGPRAVARVVDDRSGEINHAIVDVRTGETVVVTDRGATHEAPPTIAADGYLVAPAVGDPTRTIRAHDFDGELRWELALGRGAAFSLLDGTLYVTEADGTITAHR